MPSVARSGFASRVLSLSLHLDEILVQAIEALIPNPAIALDPLGDLLERASLEPAWPPLRPAAACDQSGALQYLEMLRNSGEGRVEGLGQFLDRGFTRSEARKDRAPSGVGQGPEGGAEALGRCESCRIVVCHMFN